jgi:hypothetical protein
VSSGAGSTNFESFVLNFAPPTSTGQTLLDCSNLAGTTAVKPSLNNTAQTASESFKATNFGSCTGSQAALAGPITKFTAKFSGSNSCKTSVINANEPMSGKVSVAYTALGANLKPVTSSAYVRVKYGTDDRLDVSNGLVTKGVGIGGDVSSSLLVQPTSKDKTAPQPQSSINGSGVVVPGAGSQTLLSNCIAGTGTVSTGVFGTDGTSLLGPAVNSSFKISLP